MIMDYVVAFCGREIYLKLRIDCDDIFIIISLRNKIIPASS